MRTRTFFSQRVALATMVLILGIVARANALTVYITGFNISLDAAQPVDQSALPEMGTFYLLSDYLQYGDPPPYPFNPKPGLATYMLAEPDVFVIDDTGTQFASSTSVARTMTAMDDDIMPPDDGSGDEGDPGTNAPPPFTWPVSLEDLTQIDPTNVPEACTAYLYQDQFSTNEDGEMIDPPPYPGIPEFAVGAPVYALTTNLDDGLFIVDDTGLTRPDPPPQQEYSPTVYDPGTLWLQLTNMVGGTATLVVHGTGVGRSYEILSSPSVAEPFLKFEKRFMAEQDPTILTMSMVNRGRSLFFMAHRQDDLWLELTSQGDGTASLVIHNGEPNGIYDLFEIGSLTDSSWAWTLRTSPGEAAFSLPDMMATSRFLILARTNNTDGDLMSDAWERLVSHTDQTTADTLSLSCNPSSLTVYVGETATFTASAQGPPLVYQWRFNGTNVLSQSTTDTLVISNVRLSDAGTYSVVASSMMGAISSAPLNLIVLDPFADLSGNQASRKNYQYDAGGWLRVVSGVRNESITPDNEGNIQTAH